MKKTSKVLEVMIHDTRYLVIKDSRTPYDPYKLKTKWWDGGWHVKQFNSYSNLESVLLYLAHIAQINAE